MRALRFGLLFLCFFSTSPSAHAIFGWGQPSCKTSILNELYLSGLNEHFQTGRGFKKWVRRVERAHGLPPDLIQSRYEGLVNHPELTQLMKGIPTNGGKVGTSVTLSGGWGQDLLFIPTTFELWQNVHENFHPMTDRMGRKLKLHPFLVQDLFRSDATGIGDSAWVIAESPSDRGALRSTLKVTFFEKHMTPDGPWPRYSFESLPYGDLFVTYRQPSHISSGLADDALGGMYSLRSSLHHWGMLPLEEHSGFIIPEHDPKNYPAKYAELFSDKFRMVHDLYMASVIDSFQKKQVHDFHRSLMTFRNSHFPDEALLVGELGRFNIVENAPPATKAHLFYGLVVLLHQRPIKKLYLQAPRPEDPNRPPNSYPRFEVLFAVPGWEFLANISRQVSEEQHPTEPYQSHVANPLRRMYESLGFEYVATREYVQGLPNGCDILAGETHRVMRRLIEVQLRTPEYFTTHQLETIEKIKSGLPNEP